MTSSIIESLTALYILHQDYDAASRSLEAALGVPLCIPHCGKCCVPPIACHFEAINAISTAIGEGKYREMISLCEGWLLERHKEAPTYKGHTEVDMIDDELTALMNTPCPFLQEDKTCFIYSARPVMCRALGLTILPGGKAGFCPRPLGSGEYLNVRATLDPSTLKMKMKHTWEGLPDKKLALSGLFPTLIFHEARPDIFKQYIDDNKIATAKLVGLAFDFMTAEARLKS